ncbi:DEKNAAC102804 [Brettanomyces naardenensis]|uniref:DEKNAAC102804 n=1 Tax=Brettanomyces naardenensis TaxID=13370 RepID=A0A448YKG8_BRENA|nr:DEKNAAC102804 [Brettanomyces naardenensis]
MLSVPVSLRRYLKVAKGPKLFFIILALILVFNWLFFGSVILGPFGLGSTPASVKSFRHLLNPAYLNVLQNTAGFQGRATIPVKGREIIPNVNDAGTLKQLTLDILFGMQVQGTESGDDKRYFYTPDFFEDIETPEGEKTNDIQKIVSDFKSLGRKVFAGSNSPKVVLVVGLDFEKYEIDYLQKVLPNRQEYAAKYGYGLYARWVQEFTPRLQSYGNFGSNWWRVILLREAMSAFPDAEFFWYLDEKCLILRDDINLQRYLLEPGVLGQAMLRDHPIVLPESAVRTYRSVDPQDISIILTQDSYGLSTDTMIVKNDLYGKAFLEYWGDRLYRGYENFADNEIKALAHILQWHPYLLGRTAIVPSRMINSLHTDEKAKKDASRSYQKGDFVVNLRSCRLRTGCDALAVSYLNDVVK